MARTGFMGAPCVVQRSTAVGNTGAMGAQAGAIENSDFLCFLGNRAALLEASKNTADGFHRKPKIIADIVTGHRQVEGISTQAATFLARRNRQQQCRQDRKSTRLNS